MRFSFFIGKYTHQYAQLVSFVPTHMTQMLKDSILGICVVGPEGTYRETVTNSDIVVANIVAALGLLNKAERHIATLSK